MTSFWQGLVWQVKPCVAWPKATLHIPELDLLVVRPREEVLGVRRPVNVPHSTRMAGERVYQLLLLDVPHLESGVCAARSDERTAGLLVHERVDRNQ